MVSLQLSKRYAHALYSHLKNVDEKNRALQDFEALLATLKQSPTLESFLQNPIVDQASKARVIDRLFSRRFMATTLSFLQFLLLKKRIGLLRKVAVAYLESENERLHRYHVSLFSSVSLSAAFKQSLQQRLKKSLGGEPILKEKIVAALRGGFKIQIGDLLFDHSISEKLKRLKYSLHSA